MSDEALLELAYIERCALEAIRAKQAAEQYGEIFETATEDRSHDHALQTY